MSAKESLPLHVQYWLSAYSKHDCHFIVGPESGPPETIGAFKAFLVGHSEPFRAMLQDSELKEKDYIIIDDVKPETFRHFLQCLYMNCDNVRENKVTFQQCVDLLYVADKYLVTYLKKKLVKCLLSFLQKLIGLDDVFTALSSPVFLKEKCFKNIFRDTVKSKIKEILSSPSFLGISSESLLLILKLDNVGTNEVTLWQKVLKWATRQAGSEDGKVLRQHLLKHLKFVRFCSMSAVDFFQEVVPTNILTHEEVYEVSKAIGLCKPPNLEFICNSISFRDESNTLKNKVETSFSYCFENISSITSPEQSPNFMFMGFEWRILINKKNDYLSFLLKCESPILPYTCSVSGELVLITRKGTNLSRAFDLQFCDDSPICGFKKFCLWNEIFRSRKYVVDEDSIVLLVHIVGKQ